MKKLIERLLEKLLAKPLEKLARKVEEWEREADAAREAEAQAGSGGGDSTQNAQEAAQDAPTGVAESGGNESGLDARGAILARFPLGLASCWDGANASKRHMNLLSPKMSDQKAGEYIAWMKGKGCTHAHLILANGGDGEAAGYAGWRDADFQKMLQRFNAVRDAGLIPVPWIITDDSAALLKELFKNPEKCVGKLSAFIDSAPYIVLGLEMDEGGGAASWAAVRDAVRKRTKAPIAVHHKSGNSFPFASLGEIIMGQLDPNCTEAEIKAQIKAIKAKGKRAVGFEYSRGPDRKRSLAALNAGADGCGNWDGGEVPGAADEPAKTEESPASTAQSNAEDAVDFGQLDFCWGGFKGGSAKMDSKARIYNLQVKASGLSYKWMAGGCENLGATSKSDYGQTLACFFCLIGGKWKGGKIDWISTSRTTRNFKNIEDGYGGWDKQAVGKAEKFAFVICSRDGKRRTNVILCAK